MDVEKLKKDKEFLQNLQKQKDEALKSKDIVKMYDVLDTMLALDQKDEDIDRLYQNILEIAFDKLADMLTSGERFNFEKEEDEYTARAIYEHALERWDNRDYKGSSELFMVLSFLVPLNLQEAMLLPLAATAKKIALEQFLQEFIDRSNIDDESFFFDAFTQKARDFFIQNQKLIDEELKKVEKLAS